MADKDLEIPGAGLVPSVLPSVEGPGAPEPSPEARPGGAPEVEAGGRPPDESENACEADLSGRPEISRIGPGNGRTGNLLPGNEGVRQRRQERASREAARASEVQGRVEAKVDSYLGQLTEDERRDALLCDAYRNLATSQILTEDFTRRKLLGESIPASEEETARKRESGHAAIVADIRAMRERRAGGADVSEIFPSVRAWIEAQRRPESTKALIRQRTELRHRQGRAEAEARSECYECKGPLREPARPRGCLTTHALVTGDGGPDAS